MFNKLYSMFKAFIKKYISFIIIFIILYIILNFPLPYYIHTTGGLINVSDKVSIKDEYLSSGSLNLTYVTEIRGNLLSCFLSYLLPNWDLLNANEIYYEHETYEEKEFRNHLLLNEANQNAIKVAFIAAGKDFNVNQKKHFVVYIDKNANTNLKIGDQILSVNGISINKLDDYINIVQSNKLGDILTLEIIDKDNKKNSKYIEIIELNNKKVSGIYFVTQYEYTTNPKVNFSFKESESGPSGGLMMALAIYNKLVNNDITNGKKIVGTGAIDSEGNVNEVSGIEYKLKGAVKEEANIFLVPQGNNYEEAILLKNKNNYDIIIIPIITFNDALNYLKNLGGD